MVMGVCKGSWRISYIIKLRMSEKWKGYEREKIDKDGVDTEHHWKKGWMVKVAQRWYWGGGDIERKEGRESVIDGSGWANISGSSDWRYEWGNNGWSKEVGGGGRNESTGRMMRTAVHWCLSL